MTPYRVPATFLVLGLAALAACQRERTEPTAPLAAEPESAVIRFERASGEDGPDEVLTITGLGHVTWREVRSGAVARFRISVDQLLVLEREFDDAGFQDLPDEVAGSACAACPTILLTRGVGAGERTVTLTGDPQDHPRAVREILARLDALTGRARAARQSAMGTGGTVRDRLGSGLEVALQVGRAAIQPGEPLYLRLTFTNPLDRPARLVFPTSAMADFRVETVEGEPVWSLSEERAAIPGPHEIVLAPGASRSFEEVWQGRAEGGEGVKPGSYVAVGLVPASFGGETPPVAFQVR